jgi:hypothetical protein
VTRPDPLTCELSDEDKHRLAIQFAAMRKWFGAHDDRAVTRITGTRRGRNSWQ